MNQTVLYIAFNSHQVAVYVKATEAYSFVQAWFQAMLEDKPTCVVARLVVTKQETGNYSLFCKDDAVKIAEGNLIDVLQSLKYEVIMRLIAARDDLLWFHAGGSCR